MQPTSAVKLLPLLLLTAFLAACEPVPSECASSAVTPTLFEYGREVQNQAADEFDKLPPSCPRDEIVPGCSVLRTFTKDYKTNRDEIRAINKVKRD